MYINVTITSKDSSLNSAGSAQVILHGVALQSLRQWRGWGVNSMTKEHNSAGGLFSVKFGKKKCKEKVKLRQNFNKKL